jgi:hypothetical protein
MILTVDEANEPQIVDQETSTAITRIVKTFQKPESLHKQLTKDTRWLLSAKKLLAFLKNKEPSEGYKARQFLFSPKVKDNSCTKGVV